MKRITPCMRRPIVRYRAPEAVAPVQTVQVVSTPIPREMGNMQKLGRAATMATILVFSILAGGGTALASPATVTQSTSYKGPVWGPQANCIAKGYDYVRRDGASGFDCNGPYNEGTRLEHWDLFVYYP